MSEKTLSRVLKVSGNRLKIEILMTEDMKEKNTDYYGYAFFVSASFLMALNIASLGHFSWLSGSQLFWHCEHIGPEGNVEQTLLNSKSNSFTAEKMRLTEKEVKNAVIIAGSLMKDPDQHFRKEYLKGIVHLSSNLGDLDFSKEAFANFYRSFEYFVTSQIFKKKKLSNELKELQEGIKILGLSENICEEFANLYKIRSSQVMHSQNEPKEIDIDDVIKIKVFTDFALQKYYIDKANTWLKKEIIPA